MPKVIRRRGVTGVLYTEVLFNQRGPVYEFQKDVSRQLKRTIRARAPVNKRANKNPKSGRNPYGGTPRGHLKRRISVTTHRVGSHQVESRAVSRADYSMFVIDGTGPIRAKRKIGRSGKNGGMVLPRNSGFKARRVNTVSGQRANNFMNKGLNDTWRIMRLGN